MEKRTKMNFLVRDIPVEMFNSLTLLAAQHRRSKNQEILTILSEGITHSEPTLKKPVPYKWKKPITSKYIEGAINDGRE